MVIVLNVMARTLGIVVDNVSDVFRLSAQDIRPAPDFSGIFHSRYIQGLANVGDKMLIVTDIEALLASSEMALFDEATFEKN